MPKIKEFQEILRKKKIDLAIFYNLELDGVGYDVLYFSGFRGVGVLVIPAKKKPFLVVSGLVAKKARKGLIVYKQPKGKRFFEFIKEKIKQNKIKARRIGINKEEFTLAVKDALKKNFKKIRLVDLRKELYKLREQKTKEEIRIIREGCRISDEILKKCFTNFKKFRTESEAKAFLEYEANKKGCGIAFPTIVASGKNSSEAHHDAENVKLKKGFCFIDFGIRYKGYCTDTTRTIYLGMPSEKEKEIYNFLLDVQKNAIKNVRVGKKCSMLYKEVVKNLGKYSKYFTHGLGHGIGVKIHELPNLTEKSKDRFKEGKIFTIEPGIYFKEFGIRIEDSVLIKNGEAEVLTKISKELLIIK